MGRFVSWPGAVPNAPIPIDPADVQRRSSGSARPTRLGAFCEIRKIDPERATDSFAVGEFIVMDDGERVVLHNERGWSSRMVGGPLEKSSRDDLRRSALTVVQPDDDNGEDHPWEWLAGLARSHGIDVTGEYLKTLPYEVELSENVERWLASTDLAWPPRP